MTPLDRGFLDYANGVPYENCPYPKCRDLEDNKPRCQWRLGWRTAFKQDPNASPYRSRPADLGEKRHAGHSGVKGRIG